MAEEDRSFAELVAEAPPAPAEGAVSLVGTLAKSSEHGKFVLILQDGQTITLEVSAVKGHAVLGASLGRTIVRVDVEAGKVPALSPQPLAQGVVSPLVSVPVGNRDITVTDPHHDAGTGIEGGTGPGDTGTADFSGAYDTSPLFEKAPIRDVFPPPQVGGFAPFALATPHQAPANVVEALNPPGFVSHRIKLLGTPEYTSAALDGPGTSYWGDMTVGPGDLW